jgi:hypothetical protein
LIAVGAYVFLFLSVYFFAWCKPKNLVYGETGHRAEMKFALGTDKKEVAAQELATIEGTTNPKSLSGSGAA